MNATTAKSNAKPVVKRTRKVASTPEEIAQLIAAKQAELEKLQLKVYAAELDTTCKKLGFDEAVKKVKAAVKDATDVAILSTIAKVSGMKRMVITQEAVKPRAPRKPKTSK